MQYEIHISHETILSIIYDHMPSTSRLTVGKILGDYAVGNGMTSVRQRLSASRLSRQQIDALEQCLVIGKRFPTAI
jgi:hypothetical protein